MGRKRLVSFSFDMDNLSVLADFYNLKVSPDERYLHRIYENAGIRLINFISEFNLKATFFIVGSELKKREAVQYLLQLKNQKHELANHTHNHVEIIRLSPAEQKREILNCHEAISKNLSYNTKGFRGGSMQVTPAIIEQLIDLNYSYDSSLFPSFWSFFLWAMAFLKKPSLRNLPRWRNFSAGFIPKAPFINKQNKNFVHIPVSIVPIFQIPFYATFHLLYPKSFGPSMRLVIKYRNYLIYQCHLLDFVDPLKDGITAPISHYPTYRIHLDERFKIYRHIFKTILKEYEPVTLYELSQQIKKDNYGL